MAHQTGINRRPGSVTVGLGLLAGVLGGLIIVRRLTAPRRMPNLDAWQEMLAEDRGAAEAASIAARTQARYDELHAHRPHVDHPALRFHLEKNILPYLALYEVLREDTDDQEAIPAELEHLSEPSVAQLHKLMGLLDHLPPSFDRFRRITRLVTRLGFPAPGWKVEWVEDSERGIAFNVHRCFYLDTLTYYGAPELTPLFCRLDGRMYEALPASIAWERTKTLGRGGDVCDFRWCLRDAA
jgi:hypothetical protein